MLDVLADLERWQEEGEEIALATVVKTWGSAPRPQGARFAMTRSGRLAGSVSGGCVEGDLFERALVVLDSGRPVVLHYGIADEMAFEVGLSCGGAIEVLLEPFRLDPAWDAVRQALAQQRPAALAQAIAPPSITGRRLALLEAVSGGHANRPSTPASAELENEDSAEGFRLLGGLDPELDRAVAAEARRLLLTGGTQLLPLPWKGEQAAVFVEAFPPPPRLFIVGATHVAIPLCRMARALGFRVAVIDPRSVFATRERFPEADELIQTWPDQVLDEARVDAYSYVVVLTHDPKFDVPALARALRSRARYIGVMGSRGTHERRRRRMREEGLSEEEVSRIRAPIGLDLGARSPEEMALAILAEITAVRYGRDARPLSEKRGHIHDRPALGGVGAQLAAPLQRLAVRAGSAGR